MAYNKQNWVDLPNTSTPISAERLNYMENGIYDASLSGGSGVYVGETEPTEENINAWINPNDNLLKYKNNLEWKNVIAGGDTIPIGTIVPFTGTTAPTNWLICDGSEISRTTYEDLFTKIGTSFGEGNGTDTFNLPDLRGRIPIGAGSNDNDTHNFALGSTGGEYEHTLTVAEMPSHKHNLTWYDAGSGGGAKLPYGLSSTKKTGGDASAIDNAGGNSPHNNIQPYSTVNYIIKYSNSIGLVGNVVNEKSNSTTDSYSCNFINKIKGNILWTNENPNNTMSSGIMNFNNDDYDIVEIFFLTHVTSERTIESIRFLKGYNATLQTINRSGGHYIREFTRVSDSQYSYSNGYTFTSYNNGKTETSNVCIPLYAVGYNLGIFD